MAASLDLGTLRVQVAVQNDDRGWAAAKQSGADLEKATRVNMQKVGENISKVGSGMTKWLTLPMAAAATACVKYASDMTETSGKIGVVFAENTDAVLKWSEASINQMGLAQQTALDMAASYGDLGSAMGITNDKNMEMSTSLVQLAADMASFKNISVDRAAVALNGIYTGETESLKAMGVVMTEANLEQYAMNQGIEKNIKDMSQQELVMLRYNYVLDQTTNAQGDFARTGDSTANQMRKAKETLKQLATTLGQQLIPVVNRVLTALNNMLSGLLNMDEGTRTMVITIGAVVAAIGPALLLTGKVITAITTIKAAVIAANIEINASAGIIGLVVAAVGLLVGAVASASQSYQDLTADARELDEATQKSVENIEAAEQAYKDNTVAAEANATMAEQYCQRLMALEEQGTLTREQQAEYQVILEQLAEMYPQLNLEIDEQTGLLKDGAQAIYGQIEAMKQKAIYEAAEERYKTVLKEQADQLYNKAEAEVKLNNKTKENLDLQVKRTALERQLQREYGISAGSVLAYQGAYNDLTNTQRAAVDQLLNDWGNCNRQISDNKISMDALNASIAEAGQKYEETGVKVTQAEQIMQQMGLAADAAGAATGGAANAVDELGDATETAKQKAIDYTDQVINGFAKMDYSTKDSLAKVTANLNSNNTETQAWLDNLQSLVDRGVDSGVIQKLYEMGPGYRKVVADLSKANDTEMQAFVDALQKSGELGGTNFTGGMGAKLSEGSAATYTAGKQTAQKAVQGAEDGAKGAVQVGADIGSGIASGIISQSLVIKRAAIKAVNDALDAARKAADAHSPSRKSRDLVGKPLAQGVAVGWDEEMENTLRTVKSGIGNLISGAMPPIGHIPGGKTTATATAARTASAVNQTINFTAREMTPYEEMVRVRNLSKALAQGVR